MKFRVYREGQTHEAIYFGLEENIVNNTVTLVAHGEGGELIHGGTILELNGKGIFMYPDVSKELNIDLEDSDHTVKIRR